MKGLLALQFLCGGILVAVPAAAQVCPNDACEAGETVTGCTDCQILQDFEDGGVSNWVTGGGGAAPANQATGGPLGTDDNYLQHSSGGDGEPVRMVLFNQVDWIGDFTAREQTSVYFHAVNLGSDELTLRIWLQDDANSAVSTDGQVLPADGLWRAFEFDLTAGALTGSNVATLLTQVERMRIFHGNDTTLPPPMVTATLGLDNLSNLPLVAICGDNEVNGGDVCDGVDHDGQDCTDFGYVATAGLACAAACDAFVTTGCTATCPNGTQEPGENCDDGADTATCDADCSAVSCGDGYCNSATENAASCAADCEVVCGDGLVTGSEVCDGENLDGANCIQEGYDYGPGLKCDADCMGFDDSECVNASEDEPDAGMMPVPDAGAPPGADSGMSVEEAGGGCGCGSSDRAGATTLALAVLPLLIASGRRKRKKAGCRARD